MSIALLFGTTLLGFGLGLLAALLAARTALLAWLRRQPLADGATGTRTSRALRTTTATGATTAPPPTTGTTTAATPAPPPPAAASTSAAATGTASKLHRSSRLSDDHRAPGERTTMVTGMLANVETCGWLNHLLMHTFELLHDTQPVRRWFVRKVNVELEELRASAAGRIIDSASVKEFSLGRSIPHIHNAQVVQSDTRPGGKGVAVAMDIMYNGCLSVLLDVVLRFGVRTVVRIVVEAISGRVHVRVCADPTPNWSVAFESEPHISFGVETMLEGRDLSGTVSRLIRRQLMRSIRKRHTLPNFKRRPFHKVMDGAAWLAEAVSGARACVPCMAAGALRLGSKLNATAGHHHPRGSPSCCTAGRCIAEHSACA